VNRRLALVSLVIITALFGGAMAARESLNPWWSNVAAASVAIGLSIVSLRSRLGELLVFRPRPLLSALACGAVLVVATHIVFAGMVELLPALGARVTELYSEINRTAVGPVATPLLIVLVVIGEELTWRGLAWDLADRRLGGHRRLLVATVGLYAIPQVIGASLILVTAAVVMGVFFGLARLFTGRLTEAIALHAVWSVSVFYAVPLV